MDIFIDAEIILYHDENLGVERAVLGQQFALRHWSHREDMLSNWIKQLEALRESAIWEDPDNQSKENNNEQYGHLGEAFKIRPKVSEKG